MIIKPTYGANLSMETECAQSKSGAGEKKNNTETRGYMALRNSIQDAKLELWHVTSPSEYYMIEIIIDMTIKWRTDEAFITIEQLSERMRQDKTRCYRILKSLEEKLIIHRRRFKDGMVVGLEQKFFGALLIEKHEKALQERRSKIKIAVDNSKNKCGISTKLVLNTHHTDAKEALIKCGISTKNNSQVPDIIEENPPLNTFLLKTLIKDNLKEREPGGQDRGELSAHRNGSGNGSGEENGGSSEGEEIRERAAAEEAKRQISNLSHSLFGTMPIAPSPETEYRRRNAEVVQEAIKARPALSDAERNLQRTWVEETDGNLPFEEWKKSHTIGRAV